MLASIENKKGKDISLADGSSHPFYTDQIPTKKLASMHF
jgi:hypothetical protein